MGNNKIHDQKHLTLSDRILIEQELLAGTRLNAIACKLNKDPSTIAKEIRKHAVTANGKYYYKKCHICKFFPSCSVTRKDGLVHCGRSNFCRRSSCKDCHDIYVPDYCSMFVELICDRREKSPHVCNACTDRHACRLEHKIYKAKEAQKSYEVTLSESRQGINLTEEELKDLNELISPLVKNGQPLSHVFAVHADDIPVCRRTLYNYLDMNLFTARNLDLPRRVRYKKRKKRSSGNSTVDKQLYRRKRTYKDFNIFMEAHPDVNVVEMDTVKGSRDAGKCLLTLLFRNCSFMLIILLNSCTQESVVKAINDLTDLFGIRLFRKTFPVLLTDNGPEFKNPWAIEKTPDGRHRTYVFYCDPYVSNQKARLEKNHEYIRYVIPKGRSMQKLKQEDINLMASHINSTARDSLNGATPFELASLLLDKRIPVLTGQFKVSPDDVMLKPALINKRHVPDPATDR